MYVVYVGAFLVCVLKLMLQVKLLTLSLGCTVASPQKLILLLDENKPHRRTNLGLMKQEESERLSSKFKFVFNQLITTK